MLKIYLVLIFILFMVASCGGGNSDPAPMSDGKPTIPPSGNGGITVVSVSGEIFSNLEALVQQNTIPLTAVYENDTVTLTSNDFPTSSGNKTPTILTKHPSDSEKGEICMYQSQSIIDVTGTGEIDVLISGDIEGNYVIRACNVNLVANSTTSTDWEAITTQLFGVDPVENEIVFSEGVLMSTHIVEDLTLLYVGNYAETIVDLIAEQPRAWHILANPKMGIICMNVNQIPGFAEYVSYYAAKVTVDPTPSNGYTTLGLEGVNRPVAYVPNCTFDASLWQAIWNNS